MILTSPSIIVIWVLITLYIISCKVLMNYKVFMAYNQNSFNSNCISVNDMSSSTQILLIIELNVSIQCSSFLHTAEYAN